MRVPQVIEVSEEQVSCFDIIHRVVLVFIEIFLFVDDSDKETASMTTYNVSTALEIVLSHLIGVSATTVQ